MGRWETGDSRVRPETGFQGEATGDKSLDRELRETGVRTGASPTGKIRHGRPGRLMLSRQNIFFPDEDQGDFFLNLALSRRYFSSQPQPVPKSY